MFERRTDLVDIVDALRNVGREFDNLRHFAVQVEDWIIGRLNPDLLAAFADPLEILRHIFAAGELCPEVAIVGGLRIGGLDEHAVVAALDLIEAIAERLQEIFIGRDDAPVGGELDDGLRPRDRIELADVFSRFEFLRGHVACDLDDLRNLALRRHNRIIGGLNPDFPAAFADPLIFANVEFATSELGPKLLIGRAADVFGIDEHAVMFPDDLVRIIAEKGAEILIGCKDLPIGIEFDHGERLADRLPGRLRLGAPIENLGNHFSAPNTKSRSSRLFSEKRMTQVLINDLIAKH